MPQPNVRLRELQANRIAEHRAPQEAAGTARTITPRVRQRKKISAERGARKIEDPNG